MNLPLILPLLVPLSGAILCLALRHSLRAQQVVAVASSTVLLGAAGWLLHVVHTDGVQALQAGAWPAPFGISLVADLFGALMVVLAGVMGLTITLYSLVDIDARRGRFGYFALLQVLLLGVCGAFLTGDLFNLYVWFEVLLIASFALLSLGGERPQMEGAIKYFSLNLAASIVFLAAAGLLYGKVGTLNFADLAVKLVDQPQSILLHSSAALFLVAFGVKAAIFPLYFWLPASYHTPPTAVTAIFSGLLTKVGVYALVRTFTLVFVHDVAFTHGLILVLAGLTMVAGVLGAGAQYDMRRLLSFHIVSQIGYSLMGLGLFTPMALSAAVFFTVHVSLAKSALFLVTGAVRRLRGTEQLKQLGGLYATHPLLALVFLVAALSLAGLPPLSGFFGKIGLVRAGLDAGAYAATAVALAVGMLTLFSMVKIWNEAFWKPAPESAANTTPIALPVLLWLPLLVLAGASLVLGLGAEGLLQLTDRAAVQLIDRTEYIDAVLGGAT